MITAIIKKSRQEWTVVVWEEICSCRTLVAHGWWRQETASCGGHRSGREAPLRSIFSPHGMQQQSCICERSQARAVGPSAQLFWLQVPWISESAVWHRIAENFRRAATKIPIAASKNYTLDEDLSHSYTITIPLLSSYSFDSFDSFNSWMTSRMQDNYNEWSPPSYRRSTINYQSCLRGSVCWVS